MKRPSKNHQLNAFAIQDQQTKFPIHPIPMKLWGVPKIIIIRIWKNTILIPFIAIKTKPVSQPPDVSFFFKLKRKI